MQYADLGSLESILKKDEDNVISEIMIGFILYQVSIHFSFSFSKLQFTIKVP